MISDRYSDMGSLYSLSSSELQTTETDLRKCVRSSNVCEGVGSTYDSAIANDAQTGSRRMWRMGNSTPAATGKAMLL
jgi:hypothetical protein